MTGSIALDVVIGLVFIFLLYSLLATVLCEIIAIHLGLRARNLHTAIRRMVEDNPTTSGHKIVVFFKHLWTSIYNFLWLPQGPATCIFYHLPLIKYLGRNSLNTKPSYITNQNFSKGIIEIARRYGGEEGAGDLEKIQNVINGTLTYEGILNELRKTINMEMSVEISSPIPVIDYTKLRKKLADLVNSNNEKNVKDEAQRKLFVRIKDLANYKKIHWKIKHFFSEEKSDKDVVFRIDELLNIFGHETRSHLKSLLMDAGNDLDKFRLALEKWFDDTMERAAGWYKQKVQFILFVLGFVFAVSFNASTIDIGRKLSVDKDARDKLVNLSTNYVNNPSNNPGKVSSLDNALKATVDSVWINQLDSLEKMRASLQNDLDNAGEILGSGWTLPDSLRLISIDKLKKDKAPDSDSLYHRNLNQLVKSFKGLSKIDSIETGLKKKKRFIVIIPGSLNSQVVLESLNEDQYEDYNKTSIKLSQAGYIFGSLKKGIWGYLLTAIAISLGAPFWFDILNKVVQLRGAVKDQTK